MRPARREDGVNVRAADVNIDLTRPDALEQAQLQALSVEGLVKAPEPLARAPPGWSACSQLHPRALRAPCLHYAPAGATDRQNH